MEERIGEIIAVKDETPDVRTFRLSLDKTLSFVPGQYCVVSIPGNKALEYENRPFSFSSSPTQTDFVELTVKKTGLFTTALHSLEKGNKLKLVGPQGETLNFDESVKDDVVFIAGGSGITPFISAIRYTVAKNLPNRITLFFSNRAHADIICRKELSEINKETIRVVNTLSGEAPEGWDGETGRITRAMIEKYVDNPKDKIWYICGPPPMVTSMENILNEMEIPKENLRIEKWQIPGKHDEVKGNG